MSRLLLPWLLNYITLPYYLHYTTLLTTTTLFYCYYYYCCSYLSILIFKPVSLCHWPCRRCRPCRRRPCRRHCYRHHRRPYCRRRHRRLRCRCHCHLRCRPRCRRHRCRRRCCCPRCRHRRCSTPRKSRRILPHPRRPPTHRAQHARWSASTPGPQWKAPWIHLSHRMMPGEKLEQANDPTQRMPPPSTPSPQSPPRGDSGHACACRQHGEASHNPSCIYPWLVGEGEKEEESNR
jgi:hypothetical protein